MVTTKNAPVRINIRKLFHHRGEAGLFRRLFHVYVQGVIDERQQFFSFSISQKAVVVRHFKIFIRDVADVAGQHLLLAQRLGLIPLRAVVKLMIYYRAAAVMPELERGHRRTFEIPASVFDLTPGAAGLFSNVNIPVTLILGFQIPPPLAFIPTMAKAGELGEIMMA